MTGERRILILLSAVAILALQTSSTAQFGGFAAANRRASVVDRYDRDGDGRLNRTERDAARAAMGPGGGARGRGFGGFRGQPAGPPTPGPRVTPADVRPPYPTTPLYDTGTFRTFFFEFEHPDWEQELEAFYETDVEVPARLTVDGKIYRDVGIRFRGASSFMFTPAGYKRSMRVSMRFIHDDQRLYGYRTLNLNNASNDGTFLRTLLYSEIARQYLPAAKVNLVRVVINGESWGVYVNQQQFNNDFLDEWFDGQRGARWKAPGSPNGQAGLEYLGDASTAYRRLFEIDTRDDEASWAALARMTKVLNETPIERLEAELSPLLDIDGVLRFLAVEVALVNSDGYWTRASDYNLFLDEKGQFHIVPHDFNEAFGGEGGRGGGPQLDPLVGLNDRTKPLRSKLLAVPALRARYLGYVREIAEKWLDWNTVAPKLRSTHALIADHVRADTRKLSDTREFDNALAETGALKSFLDRRRAYLLSYAPR